MPATERRETSPRPTGAAHFHAGACASRLRAAAAPARPTDRRRRLGMALTQDVAELLAEPEIRVEGALKVGGRARYVNDVRLPGMLWARFLLSPHPHALTKSIDTSK